MKKKLAILNAIFLLVVVAVNYVTQAIRLNDVTIGDVSHKYQTLFTPADYAFSIWGVIYFSLFAFVGYQIKQAFFSKSPAPSIEQTGYWLILTNVLNCLWVVAFMYEYLGLAAIIMVFMFVSLLKIIVNTNMERWDAPIEVLAFVWWPICFYSGWLAVALISNVASYLVQIGWDGGSLSPEVWTVVMLIVAVIINVLMIWKRNMREFAMVGVWALLAIFIRHYQQIDLLAYTALAGCIVLLLNIGVHGYRQRDTNPFFKLKQRL